MRLFPGLNAPGLQQFVTGPHPAPPPAQPLCLHSWPVRHGAQGGCSPEVFPTPALRQPGTSRSGRGRCTHDSKRGTPADVRATLTMGQHSENGSAALTLRNRIRARPGNVKESDGHTGAGETMRGAAAAPPLRGRHLAVWSGPLPAVALWPGPGR